MQTVALVRLIRPLVSGGPFAWAVYIRIQLREKAPVGGITSRLARMLRRPPAPIGSVERQGTPSGKIPRTRLSSPGFLAGGSVGPCRDGLVGPATAFW